MPSQFIGRAVPIHKQVKRKPKRVQVLEMQDILKAGLTNDDEPLAAKAQAARAWDVLEDRLRELQGKPKLAPIKAEPKARKQRPTAPLSEGPAVPQQ